VSFITTLFPTCCTTWVTGDSTCVSSTCSIAVISGVGRTASTRLAGRRVILVAAQQSVGCCTAEQPTDQGSTSCDQQDKQDDGGFSYIHFSFLVRA